MTQAIETTVDDIELRSAPVSKKNEEIKDIVLFIGVMICSIFLTWRKIITDGEGQDFGQLLQPYLLWPLMILFVALWMILAYRRKKFAGVDPFHKILGSLFVAYFVVRLVGYFMFPYGEVNMIVPWDGTYYDINYSGFGVYDRITEYLSEMLEISSFYIMFIYYPSFKLFRKRLVKSFLWLIVAIAIGLSIIICTAYIRGNTPLIFIPRDQNPIVYNGGDDYFSIIHHKNFYGLFLIAGAFSCMVLTYMKPNLFYVILTIGFTALTICLYSRTSMFLCAIILASMVVVCPIFNFKKHKVYFTVCMVLIGLAIIAIILLETAMKDTKIGQFADYVMDLFHNKGTVNARHQLTQAGMNLTFSDIYYVIFGFGKTPFYNIFKAYQIAHNGELTITCHNAWFSCLATTGVVGVSFVVALDLFVLYMIMSLIRIKKFDMMACYLIGGAILLVYTQYEFRMLFFNDSMSNNTMTFYLCYLFPILYSYSLVDETIALKNVIPEKLVYPSVEE